MRQEEKKKTSKTANIGLKTTGRKREGNRKEPLCKTGHELRNIGYT